MLSIFFSLIITIIQISRAGWRSTGDSLTSAYLSRLPKKFIRTMAGFPGTGSGYYLPRAQQKPSLALQQEVFPWVEAAELRIARRGKRKAYSDGGLDEDDFAAQGFIELLKTLRIVLLQDLAVLRGRFPDLLLFQHPLFSSAGYLEFAASVQHGLLNSDEPREVLLERLVPKLSETIYKRTELAMEVQRQNHLDLTRKLGRLETNLNAFLTGQASNPGIFKSCNSFAKLLNRLKCGSSSEMADLYPTPHRVMLRASLSRDRESVRTTLPTRHLPQP